MIKVAYDLRSARGGNAVRGIGVHTNELIEALEKEKSIEILSFENKIPSCDLVHYTQFNPYYWSIPIIKPKSKVVLTVHDLIRLVFPTAYPPGIKGQFRFMVQKYLINRYVDRIITISETSKKDIVRFLGVSPDRVNVVYLAPRKELRKLESGNWKSEIKKRYSLPDHFVLYVGDVNYNKNLLTLAEACRLINIPLVMVGKMTVSIPDDHSENISWKIFLKKYGNDNLIIRLGFVEDEELVKIWNLATVYCQPSLYEGFSFPLLESMACGVPVVASRINVHTEIGDNACLYAEPKESTSFAKEIRKVISDKLLAKDLAMSGLKRVKYFSWDKTAKDTIKVYEKTLAGS